MTTQWADASLVWLCMGVCWFGCVLQARSAGPVVLENFETLDTWHVWPEATV
jgi:hypothetical protein